MSDVEDFLIESRSWPHKAVPNLDDISVVKDNRDGTECEACGSRAGVEWHHWAPFHLFGDEAEQWPKSSLCRACHQRWHQTTRTGLWWTPA